VIFVVSVCDSSPSVVAPNGRVLHMSYECHSETKVYNLQRATTSNNSWAGNVGVTLALPDVGS
jgi:hypothetical protein